ncbi:MAG: hypothetical protein AAGB12_03545 [Pseudomonadota bacterium]
MRQSLLAVFMGWAATHSLDIQADDTTELQLGLGYDSNPHQLATDAALGTSVYTQLFIDGREAVWNDALFVEFEADRKDYRPIEEESASTYAGVGLSYEFKTEALSQLKMVTTWNYRLYDATYFSRETGFLAFVNAVDVSDRFDVKWNDFELASFYAPWESITFEGTFSASVKDYENLEVQGLESLDNQSFKFFAATHYQPFEQLKLSGWLSLRTQDYNDKFARDEAGLLVDETLSFNETEIGFDLTYRIASWQFHLGYGLGTLEDSLDGYFDMDNTWGEVGFIYLTDDGDRFQAQYREIENLFANEESHVIDEFDEKIFRDRDGYQWHVSYNISIKKEKDYEFEFFFDWTVDSYDSFDTNFTFDRQTFVFGLRSLL